MQIIESDLMQDQPQNRGEYDQGVAYDAQGRAVAYSVLQDGDKENEYRIIPASQMCLYLTLSVLISKRH